MNKRKNMLQALRIASQGQDTTSPNPMVGCLIENNGKIVGSGWHKYAGGDHAEVSALKQAGYLARGATMYINLEPCSHFGRTPPCTDVIIAAQIKKIYIAIKDPNPLVNGYGIKELLQAGIEIELGICEKEATDLNKVYLHYITKNRPYVICKWAMSLDGKIATCTNHSKWISSEESRKHTHQIRQICDAILVGTNTVLIDNPKLTVRKSSKIFKQPIRIILDSKGRLPLNLNIFDPALPGRTIICTTNLCNKKYLETLHTHHIEALIIKTNHKNQISLAHLLDELGKLKISSLLVEGGAAIHTSFFNEGLVNKAFIYIAPKIIGGFNAISPILGDGKSLVPNYNEFYFESITRLKNDIVLTINKGDQKICFQA